MMHCYRTCKLKGTSQAFIHTMCRLKAIYIQIYYFLFRDALRYSFGTLIQRELDEFATEWNSHRIRHSRMAEQPPGVPNVLYKYPVLHGIAIREIVHF